ncbi:MAG: hypothetical protein ACJ72Z_08780 [Pyrinomonadaceae bacterium]
MFCPKCGNADQQAESYCRNCGEFLVDYSGSSFLLNKLLGGSTPATQINVNLAINLLTILACFFLIGFLNGHYDALRVRTGEQPPAVVYWVYAFLIFVSAWQTLSLIIGARLRSRLRRKVNAHAMGSQNVKATVERRPTLEQLPAPDFAQAIPVSVTEEPTKLLDPSVKTK